MAKSRVANAFKEEFEAVASGLGNVVEAAVSRSCLGVLVHDVQRRDVTSDCISVADVGYIVVQRHCGGGNAERSEANWIGALAGCANSCKGRCVVSHDGRIHNGFAASRAFLGGLTYHDKFAIRFADKTPAAVVS